MLGLNNEVSLFETRHAGLGARRRGLRLPFIPTGFDGLCWGIIGQQINVKFAGASGAKSSDWRARSSATCARIPRRNVLPILVSPRLQAPRFSRSKAHYLIGAAREVAERRLDIESLHRGSAVAAEKKLTALHGIGTWTARYVMLRGGFADAAPVGDSALATALQRLHATGAARTGQSAKLMAAFSPHRSLATMHLWTSLKDAA